ncbi:MAG: starch-binding protein [Lachnospiraceae bacterium]|nr:starch-binding protein [Lachnospiraceae bacterium]
MHKNKRKEGMKKMRKIFRKVVAAVASAAMLAGLVAGMPAIEAKADSTVVSAGNPISITVHFKKPDTWSNVYLYAGIGDQVKRNITEETITNPNYNGYTGPNNASALLTEDAAHPGWYSATVTTELAWGVDFVFGDADWSAQTEDIWFAYSMPSGTYEFWVTMDDMELIKGNSGAGSKNRLGLSAYANLYGDTSKPYIAVDSLAVAPTGWNGENTTTAPAGENTTTAPVAENTTTAPAATEVKVKVKLDASIAWEKVMLYAWADSANNTWPGVEMTKNGDYYEASIPVLADKMSMIVNNGDGKQTIDITDINVTSGNVEITVSAEEQDGKLVASAGAPATGDATPYVAVIAAMLALGCAVVALNAKKENE